ncbi:MAG: hypothetical protein RJB65_1135 [Actinomycetota bacterium]|jgi:hypothetical protein
MSAFGVAALRSGSARGRGSVDHRLARRHLINEFHRGRLRQDQVCDAHPELIRAARNVGMAASVACPICTERGLRLVTYVFGPRLPASGKVLSTASDLAKLQARPDELTAYVVEACIECHWHHLLKVLPVRRLGRKAAS